MDLLPILVPEMLQLWMQLKWFMEVAAKEVQEIAGLTKQLR
jgi:hypothetical protein